MTFAILALVAALLLPAAHSCFPWVQRTLAAARWHHLNDGVSRLRALWLAVTL
jgi:hypothetical protein